MKSTGSYPRVHVDTAKVAAVGGRRGPVDRTIRAAGLDRALSEALARWRKPSAVHDPGKVICDLALSLVLGGEALSDLAALRAEPGVYGPVASDDRVPTHRHPRQGRGQGHQGDRRSPATGPRQGLGLGR